MKRGLVGFSEYLGISSLLSLGIVLGLGVWGFGSLGAVLMTSAGDAPLSLGIAALVFLPVILCLLARASEARGGYTPYAVVRRSGSAAALFATGWLSLAGYVAIASIMVESIGRRAVRQLQLFADFDVPLVSLVGPVTVLAALIEFLAPNQRPALRSFVRWALAASVAGFLLWVLTDPPPVDESVVIEHTEARHWFSGVAVAAAGLWVVELLLDHRGQFRRDDRRLGLVLLVSWLACGALSVLAAALALEHPDLFLRSESVGHMLWERDRLRLAASVFTYAIAAIGLVKALTRATRLAGAMAVDRLLPERFEQQESSRRLPGAVLVVLSTTVALLASFAEFRLLIGVAAVSVLWVALLTIGFGVKADRPVRAGAVRLPFHPVLPLLALASAAFFSFIVPQPAVPVTAGWLLLGFAVRPLFGRTAEIVTETSSDGEESPLEESKEGRVLVCLGPSSVEEELVRAGAALARARGGDLVVLQVVSLLEQLPRARVREHAERACEALDGRLEAAALDVEARALVRIAPTVEAGLVETANRYAPDVVLLDLPKGARAGDPEHVLFLEHALTMVAQPTVVLRGGLAEAPARVVAAVGDGPDTPTVLDVGGSWATAWGTELTAVHVHGRVQDEEEAREKLGAMLEDSGVDADSHVVEAEDPMEGLVELADGASMLIVGCTRDRASTATLATGGLWAEALARWKGPLALVRRREAIASRWLHRLWNGIFLHLPTLTVGERAEVYAEMRHSAAAGVDFFVLITIAASIATFGLVQDSAAVIIGAMLVAPLMSPIVAIAQGIVQGNLRMIRKSLSSTAKGSTVAVGVATAFVLAVPDMPPTGQILARTAPTLLDLGVGLAAGAAAAYGVSRKSVSAALPGTAISVALVPPLCVVGFGLASDRLDIAVGALLLFLTNLSAIVFVSVVVFLLLGFFPRAKERHAQVRGAISLNLLVLALLSVPLGISSCHSTREAVLESAVAEAFRSVADARAMHLRNVVVDEDGGVFTVTAGAYSPEDVTEAVMRQLRAEVEEIAGIPVRLELLVVRASRLSAEPPADG